VFASRFDRGALRGLNQPFHGGQGIAKVWPIAPPAASGLWALALPVILAALAILLGEMKE